MILEKYRSMLPPYWYENQVADYHFEAAESEMVEQIAKIEQLRNQFFPMTATYSLDVWDWIYFGTKQFTPDVQRRQAIKEKYWSRVSFTPAVLRNLGLDASTLKVVTMEEVFATKRIRYTFKQKDMVDVSKLVKSFEKIRPVHAVGIDLSFTGSETIQLVDTVTMATKRYRKVRAMRVGLAPMMRGSEIAL
ncbi:hypothetical protein [Brevibacillus choshinensis]|uniref:DUF2313 domain-containing protein n=1 Tax=Brevibacillus choshinensis TaxID=54911 RepID=A0ABX7FGD2_BRECH|nr:hypothetical protein [Brevibacillus choshinensis]QRG65238.1 hypothetical protein JNE38_16475 [Brevibacillus choshinensis]